MSMIFFSIGYRKNVEENDDINIDKKAWAFKKYLFKKNNSVIITVYYSQILSIFLASSQIKRI